VLGGESRKRNRPEFRCFHCKREFEFERALNNHILDIHTKSPKFDHEDLQKWREMVSIPVKRGMYSSAEDHRDSMRKRGLMKNRLLESLRQRLEILQTWPEKRILRSLELAAARIEREGEEKEKEKMLALPENTIQNILRQMEKSETMGAESREKIHQRARQMQQKASSSERVASNRHRCEVCDVNFDSYEAWKAHLAPLRPRSCENEFECPLCAKALFRESRAFKQHLFHKHGIPLGQDNIRSLHNSRKESDGDVA